MTAWGKGKDQYNTRRDNDKQYRQTDKYPCLLVCLSARFACLLVCLSTRLFVYSSTCQLTYLSCTFVNNIVFVLHNVSFLK